MITTTTRGNVGRIRTAIAAVALGASFALGTSPRPASADGAASTRNIILGAAAVAAGIVIENNVRHKRAAHDAIVGYTRDGGTVYGDGRIVYPNGRVSYASNGDGRACGYDGYGERCGSNPVAYRSRDDRDDRNGGDERGRRGRWHDRQDRHDDHGNHDDGE